MRLDVFGWKRSSVLRQKNMTEYLLFKVEGVESVNALPRKAKGTLSITTIRLDSSGAFYVSCATSESWVHDLLKYLSKQQLM
jgi:hypothetical protein